MSEQLTVTTRDIIGKKVKDLRQAGFIPAVLYGSNNTPRTLAIDAKLFGKVSKEAGSSTLVDLIIDEAKPIKVLIHDRQYNAITGQPIHADLFQVKLTEKMQTEIPLSFIGESEAVESLGGSMLTVKDSVNVEAFPQDLVSEIEIDISQLATFEDKITVADVKPPTGVTILDEMDETIAVVNAPRTDEELEAELAETTPEEEDAAVAATEAASTEPSEDDEQEGDSKE